MDKTTELQVREANGRREVFDVVRRRWVALTPEEWVRQQTIALLHNGYGYPLELMRSWHWASEKDKRIRR